MPRERALLTRGSFIFSGFQNAGFCVIVAAIMDAPLEHLSLNVSDPAVSFPFYKDLLRYFGYDVLMDEKDYIAFRKKGTPDFWITPTEEKYLPNKFHRKNTGINHFAFHPSSKEDVDKFYEEFLKPHGIKTLYDSPKLFPQYTPDYYAVFFEDPDRIKLEVCFISNERDL